MGWFRSEEWQDFLVGTCDPWRAAASEISGEAYDWGRGRQERKRVVGMARELRFGLLTLTIFRWCGKNTKVDPSLLWELYIDLNALRPGRGWSVSAAMLERRIWLALGVVERLNLLGTTDEKPEGASESLRLVNVLDARDAWMYEQRKNGAKLNAIMRALPKHGFRRLSSETAVSNAIKRFADREGLPQVERRKPGRPKKEN